MRRRCLRLPSITRITRSTGFGICLRIRTSLQGSRRGWTSCCGSSLGLADFPRRLAKLPAVFTPAGHWPQGPRHKSVHTGCVQSVLTSQWFQGKYKNEQQDRSLFFPRFGADVERIFDVYTDFRMPEEQKQAFYKDRTGCIVSAHLAKRMNFNAGDKITIVGDI